MEEETKVPGEMDLSASLPSGNEIGREPEAVKYERERVEQENSQRWYQTLGVATDENTETFFDAVADSFTSGGNFGYQVASRLEMESAHKIDPDFDPNTLLEQDKKVIAPDYWSQLALANSAEQYADIKNQITKNMEARKRLERLGVAGQLTSAAVAGILDIDMPLSVGVGFVGKAGLLSTRLGRGLAGSSILATSAAIGESASVTPEWGNVAFAALMGMGFGSIGPGGKVDPLADSYNKSLADAIDGVDGALQRQAKEASFDEAVPSGPTFRRPQAIEPEAVQADTVVSDKGSAGARQLLQTEHGYEAPRTEINEVTANSKAYLKQTGVHLDYFYDYAPALEKQGGKFAAEAFRKFSDTIQAFGLATDFDKMFKTGSATAQWLAHTTGVHPAGIISNRRSAANLMNLYEQQLHAAWRPAMDEAYAVYAKENGQSMFKTWTGGGELKRQFYREIMSELEARRLDGPADAVGRKVNPHIAKAADGVDAWSKLDVEIGKGKDSETYVLGYEDLNPYSGYAPRRVSAGAIRKAITEKGYSEKDITDAFAEFYSGGGVYMDLPTARKVAKSVLNRAKAQDRGMDVNLWGLLQGDGRELLAEQLSKEGLSTKTIDKIIERMTGSMEQRGKQGHTKGRLDGDIRFQASNGIKIIDLLDTDLEGLLTHRSRTGAGRAALARQGIQSKADMDLIIDTILHEQQNAKQTVTNDIKGDPLGTINDFIDKDRHLSRQWLENYFAYFTGGIKNDDSFHRIRKLTGLATLSQLGLTQAAEFGAVSAGIGIKEFFRQLPDALRHDLVNPNSPLAQELNALTIFQREELLHSPRFHSDFNNTMHAQSDIMDMADNLLGAGQRLQGIVSGFYKVRAMQQRMAVMGATNNLFKFLRDGTGHTEIDRLATWGVDAKMIERLKENLHHVEWEDGHVRKLNLEKWDDQLLVEDFALAMNNAVDQMVQKARVGETYQFMHKNGVMSLFWQLKSFPMTAIQKQFGRSVYQGDAESLMLGLHGLISAGAAMTAKSVVNGQTENLSPEKLGKLAVNMSNTFGWIPMFTDPFMQIMGIDAKLSPYSYGRDNSIISTPVALTTLNKMSGIPSALVKLPTGNLSASDVQALRSIPVFGNMYGMGNILGAFRD